MAHFPLKRKWTRKPNQPVGIDWSHPASKHLVKAFFFNTNKTVDSAKGGVDSEVNITYERNNFNSDGTAGNKATLDSPLRFPNNEGTIIFRGSSDGGNTSSGILSDKDVSGWGTSRGLQLSYHPALGELWLFIGTAENQAQGMPAKFSDAGIVGRFKVGEIPTMYFNEKKLTSDIQNSAPAYVEATINARIGTSYDEAASRTWNGSIDALLVFDRKLPLDLSLSLSRNPYQLLKPRTQYISLVADVASSFQPAWALNRTAAIGVR